MSTPTDPAVELARLRTALAAEEPQLNIDAWFRDQIVETSETRYRALRSVQERLPTVSVHEIARDTARAEWAAEHLLRLHSGWDVLARTNTSAPAIRDWIAITRTELTTERDAMPARIGGDLTRATAAHYARREALTEAISTLDTADTALTHTTTPRVHTLTEGPSVRSLLGATRGSGPTTGRTPPHLDTPPPFLTAISASERPASDTNRGGLMTITTTQHAHETPEQLQRLAYQLHHVDNLPWSAVAEELDEPMEVVKDLAQAYIDRTDAAAAETQAELFELP